LNHRCFWEIAGGEGTFGCTEVCPERMIEFLFDVKLREIEARVSPAKSTYVILSHARDIEINFIAFVAYSINILKINAMKGEWIFKNGITPRKRVGAF
jgi:hypothetical protein